MLALMNRRATLTPTRVLLVLFILTALVVAMLVGPAITKNSAIYNAAPPAVQGVVDAGVSEAEAAAGATVCNRSTRGVYVQRDSGSYTTLTGNACAYNVKRVYIASGRTMRVSWNYIDFGSRSGPAWWYPNKGTWRVNQYV